MEATNAIFDTEETGGTCYAKASSPEDSPEIRLLLVGKTGVGKSASGNTILGRREFISKTSDFSVTTECKKGDREVAGRRVVVVDTPAVDTDPSQDEQTEKWIAEHDLGPHAILLVIEVARFTEEDKKTVKTILRRFGEEAGRCMMVLFTHGDKLEDKTIEEYIQGANQELQQIVQKCGNRYHTFNNRNKDKENHTQVTELLEKIKRMVAENKGSCYTTEMYQQAKSRIRQEQERMRQGKEKNRSELRMVLLGRTRTGKSASGNTILGSEKFESGVSFSALTRQCKKMTEVVNGKHLTVFDTPDILSIISCDIKAIHALEPHVFLLVIPLGQFTEDDSRDVDKFQKMFGEKFVRYTTVLFTHRDNLTDENIEEFVEKNKELQQLVQKCGGRYHVFNNKNMSDHMQVTDLLDKIDRMVAENEGNYWKLEPKYWYWKVPCVLAIVSLLLYNIYNKFTRSHSFYVHDNPFSEN